LLEIDKAKQRLKLATNKAELRKTQYQSAHKKALQLRTDAQTMQNQMKQTEKEFEADAEQAKNKKGAEQLAIEVAKAKEKTKSEEEGKEAEAAAGFKNITQEKPIWGMPCSESPPADLFENLIPEMPDTFREEMKRRKKMALEALDGTPKERAQFIESCEMNANCRALGGIGNSSDSLKNCDPSTKCSAGSAKTDARPCKTCATMFVINRWRSINRLRMAKCSGAEECQPTPFSWRLCTTADVSRNPAVCKKAGIGRDPAPVDIFNPGQDVTVAHTHCTSCHEGEALEMVHPTTRTGICRRFGPANGTANLISFPYCHDTNDNYLVSSDSKSQVCTKIFRPSLLHAGNQTLQPYLANHNKYSYVTCNVRKMVSCEPSEHSFQIEAKPASNTEEQQFKQQSQCTTETQVSCANVCRLKGDGTLCPKNSTCTSSKSSTSLQLVKIRSQLLGTPFDLSQYDCDPRRCEPRFCQQAAMA